MRMSHVPSGLIAASGLLLVGLLLFAAPEPQIGVRAQLFGAVQVLDLKLNGQDSVEGALGGALLPGETVRGELLLSHTDAFPSGLLDLDFDFRSSLTDVPPASSPDLRHLLVAAELRYGADDLLRDDPGLPGDRNLTREIDSHPLLGNNDGLLSLAELGAGANDLPAPGSPASPTSFVLGVRLQPTAGNAALGDTVALDIVFFLSDVANSDLN